MNEVESQKVKISSRSNFKIWIVKEKAANTHFTLDFYGSHKTDQETLGYKIQEKIDFSITKRTLQKIYHQLPTSGKIILFQKRNEIVSVTDLKTIQLN